MGKMIKRIQGSRLLISSLPGSALGTHVESLRTSFLKALSGKLDIKRHSPCFPFIFIRFNLVKVNPGGLSSVM